MTEIVLVTVIIVLVSLIGWLDYNNRKERKKMLNAIIAKNPEQYRDMEIADKTKIDVKPTPTEPDLIPESQLSDEEFQKHIERINKGAS